MLGAIFLVIITIFVPPLGVFLVSGCGMDLLINLLLTLLGYLPGHLHAFYVEWVYYSRREEALLGQLPRERAQGVYSDHVQRGGIPEGHYVQGGPRDGVGGPSVPRAHGGPVDQGVGKPPRDDPPSYGAIV